MGLVMAAQSSRIVLAEQVPMIEKRTALTNTAKSKLPDELSRLRAKFKSYRRKSEKKLDGMTTCDSYSQSCLTQSEKERCKYYAEKWQLSSREDRLENEVTIVDRQLRDPR